MPGLVVFDLDGTLLRGPTVCELLAEPLGKLDRMRGFEKGTTVEELMAARQEMASWYREVPRADLLAGLQRATWAPEAFAGLRLLHQEGFTVAIASITWRFAVEWFAQRLGVDLVLGTGLSDSGAVEHVWPPDKAAWLRELRDGLRVPLSQVVAVGDSGGDVDLLLAAGHAVYVGETLPPALGSALHLPNGSILTIAQWVVEQLGAADGSHRANV